LSTRGSIITSSPGVSFSGPVGELAAADLRPAQVGKDGHVPVELLRRGAHALVDLAVGVVGAMGHVEPHHVHPGFQQFGDGFRVGTCRTQGGHDLGPAPAQGNAFCGQVHGGSPIFPGMPSAGHYHTGRHAVPRRLRSRCRVFAVAQAPTFATLCPAVPLGKGTINRGANA
jgi:hypothetical protein